MAKVGKTVPISESTNNSVLTWSYSRRIGSNLLWLFAGDVCTKALAFLSTVWLARRLSDEGFGQLAILQAIVVYLSLVVDAGLSAYGAREIARRTDQAEKISSNIVVIRVLLAIMLCALFSLGVAVSSLTLELKALFIGGGLWLLPQALNLEFSFQGLERMQYVSLGRFVVQFAYLILVFLCVRGRDDLWSVPYYKAAAGAVAAAVLIRVFWRSSRHLQRNLVDIGQWRNYLSVSVIMALSFVVIKVYYTFDTLMLGVLDRPEVVGWYNAAYKIVLLFVSIATLVQFAFGPMFSRERNNRYLMEVGLRRFALLLTFLGGLFAGTTILASERLIAVLYGTTYASAVNALILLSISVLFIFLDTVFLCPLLYGGFQKQYLWTVLIGAGLNILLNSVAIPLFSYKGAAATTIASNAVIASAGYLRFRRQFFFPRAAIKAISGTVAICSLTFGCCMIFFGATILGVTTFILLFSGSFFLISSKMLRRSK